MSISRKADFKLMNMACNICIRQSGWISCKKSANEVSGVHSILRETVRMLPFRIAEIKQDVPGFPSGHFVRMEEKSRLKLLKNAYNMMCISAEGRITAERQISSESFARAVQEIYHTLSIRFVENRSIGIRRINHDSISDSTSEGSDGSVPHAAGHDQKGAA